MVKVVGPCLSLGASGTIGDALTFFQWKGRACVRERVTPANPKSAGQRGVRAMFKFLAQVWDGLTAGNKSSWEDRAKAKNVSPFNAFMSFNQSRHRDDNTPTKEYPPAETSTAPSGPTGTATPDGRSMILEITDGANAPDWGYVIYRSLTSSFTPAWSNAIAVVPWDSSGTTTYVDSPLDPDTYYYNARGFMADGKEGADGTEFNGTIT